MSSTRRRSISRASRSRRGSNAEAYDYLSAARNERRRSRSGSRRGSNAEADDYLSAARNERRRSRSVSRRGSRSVSRRGSRSEWRRGGRAPSATRSGIELDQYLENISMLEHVDTLRENGFSSLDVLKFATSTDLEDLGLSKGHALLVSKAIEDGGLRGIRANAVNRRKDVNDLKEFLRSMDMEDHLDLLLDHGFSSLRVLKYADVPDLESLGLLKGHAVIIARTKKPLEDTVPIASIIKASDLGLLDFEDMDNGGYSMKVHAGFQYGNGVKKIYLWEKGSTITFHMASSDDFYYEIGMDRFDDDMSRSEELYEVFVECFNTAYTAWNSADIGVTFQPVRLKKDATFDIEFQQVNKEGDGILAQSFYPKDYNDYEDTADKTMYIHNVAFEDCGSNFRLNAKQMQKRLLTRTAAHELGHVLGLRHEDWIENEHLVKAMRIGEPDKNSIMKADPVHNLGYLLRGEPLLTESDKRYVKELYTAENKADNKRPAAKNKAANEEEKSVLVDGWEVVRVDATPKRGPPKKKGPAKKKAKR